MFTKKAARLADKLRFVSVFVLIALLVVGFLLKDKAGIEYFLYPVYDDKEVIDSVFEEENPFVVMYPNSAEDKIAATAAAIAADKDVKSVTTYAGTLGITLGVDEAVELISTRFPDLIGSVPPSMSAQITVIMQDLFKTYLGKEELDGTETVEMYGFVSYVLGDMLTDDSVNNIVKTLILSDPETKAQCDSVKAMLDSAKAQLVGENYSRIMVTTRLQKESDEAFAFVERLDGILKENMGEYYIMGNSYLAYEMRASYSDEVNLITLISIVLIFIVVALTFKSLIIPTVLVALIQCAVYLTLSFSHLAHLEFYYLAVIIVQAILMGATIDYAILFTNNCGFARRGVFQLDAYDPDLVVDTVFRNADTRAYGKGPVDGSGVSCDSDRKLLCGGALRNSSARNFGGAGQAYMLQREKVGRIERQDERKILQPKIREVNKNVHNHLLNMQTRPSVRIQGARLR